jgi:hypothetical protein
MHTIRKPCRRGTMNSKEKLQRALNHLSGPVPVDFGSTAVTGIHASVVADLRKIFGLKPESVKIHEPYQMLGYPEQDLLEAMGVDVIGITPRNTLFGFPLENWKEWRTPWGQEVLVPGNFNVTYSGDDVYIYPEGDTTAPASGHMPGGGYFFDAVIRQEPIDDDALDPADNLEEFGALSDQDLEYFKKACQDAQQSGMGVTANFGGTAFGDIALVPAPNLKHPKGIRDVTEWYVSTAVRQDYIHEIFEKQADIAIENLERIVPVVGSVPDAVFICGTDFGTQSGQFCSRETLESLYAPYYRRVNDWIHRHTSWKTFKHSCGAVEPFMEAFIEAGFDIINPVQCSAAGMEPEHLKSSYGDRLTFWGGGVDTQQVLPFGTPEEVRRQVRSRLDIFSRNGGYVFNAIHNVQARTPIENLEALLDEVRKFNEGR